MIDKTSDICVKRFGPQLHVLNQGRDVAVAITTDTGEQLRLIAATSLIGKLITYLSRARTRAVDRLNESGIDHQVTTIVENAGIIEPKSVNLAVARDRTYGVLQVTDADGASVSLSLTPDLMGGLAGQMAHAHKDMKK